MPSGPTVLVTGDVVVDCHLYERDRPASSDATPRGLHLHEEYGGAVLTQRLIQEVLDPQKHGEARTPFDLTGNLAGVDQRFRAYALWQPTPKAPGSKQDVWRMVTPLGYVQNRRDPKPAEPASRCALPPWPPVVAPQAAPDVLVLDDNGACFRNADWMSQWCLPQPGEPLPRHILLKLSEPVGAGDLWHRLQSRADLRERLAVLVSARALRNAGARLSRGLSWERSIEHLLAALFADGGAAPLRALTNCRYLIVTFEHDGAVWIDCGAQRQGAFVFDAAHAEGEWLGTSAGRALAYQTCAAAALARQLVLTPSATPDFGDALERGLSAMRRLREDGHGSARNRDEPIGGSGFPVATLAQEIRDPQHRFARSPLPDHLFAGPPPEGTWSVLTGAEHATRSNPLYITARQILLRGQIALDSVPHLRIGKLWIAGRDEQQAYRSLRRQLNDYKHPRGAGRKPLSIGVFGPPGAGKSFGVRELATGIFGDRADADDYAGWLEFNLSQFSAPADLAGAFHQVRDKVLQGLIPVVFWDEFDSQDYRWLQYLLAPMQDGRFQEGQLTHTLGRCVFIFAGGTAATFDAFGPTPANAAAWRAFALAKGPDFKSRLDGHLNVLGPNPAPSADPFFPVRRAILLRGMLGCKPDERLEIDPGLVTALLQVPEYRHGARSLEKVIEPFKINKGERRLPLLRWQLPAPHQLDLHVDGAEFHRLCRANPPMEIPEALVERVAAEIHASWRDRIHETGERTDYDVAFADLPAETQNANRAAARRMSGLLALAGLELSETADTEENEAAVRAHIEHHLELLAAEEHERWMEEKRAAGWTYGKPRKNTKKQHDCLVPLAQLDPATRTKDRNQVRHFPDYAKKAGLRIVFMNQG